MTDPAITIDAVTKRYGSQVALDDVSATIAPGEKLALLGHNGAGKTTLIKLILGLTRPQSGKIDVLGEKPGSDAMRRQCAYLPENVAFHKSLTGREQLTLFSRLKGGPASRIPAISIASALPRQWTVGSAPIQRACGRGWALPRY